MDWRNGVKFLVDLEAIERSRKGVVDMVVVCRTLQVRVKCVSTYLVIDLLQPLSLNLDRHLASAHECRAVHLAERGRG